MSIRTNYEKWYECEGYYWGTEPAGFCDELIALCPPSKDKKFWTLAVVKVKMQFTWLPKDTALLLSM